MMRAALLFAVLGTLAMARASGAQPPAPTAAAVTPAKVEVSPARAEAEIGQTLNFTAVAYDANGARLDLKPLSWFTAPFDAGIADETGAATFYYPGEVRIGAIVGGKPGFAVVTVKPPSGARIALSPSALTVPVGGGSPIKATVFTRQGDPLGAPTVTWSSESPGRATVDDAGFVIGVAPGTAKITARSGAATASINVLVVRNPAVAIEIEPRSARGRTGDVLHFAVKGARGIATSAGLPVRWSVTGAGARIDQDGGFVAEQPGSYVVTASSGDRSTAASVVIVPRSVARPLERVGRTPLEEFQTLEQWIVGKYAYVTSLMAGRLWVYEISNPAAPVKVDSVTFDARVLNDVSTTADGKIAVVTREGASNRKNGIVFLDTSDPAHPKVVSEYTETVSGGVHSAFIDGHYVYLTDDATGSLRVIDFRDAKAPKEVGRWQVENPLVRQVKGPDGEEATGGRYLHDVQVVDGLLYAGYWRDGLIILDVGKGIRGGSPQKPQFVSQVRFNYHELYGDGWIAGAHAVFRYKDYVFVGDEVFPAQFDLVSRNIIPVKGMVHVVDVSDLERPKEVAVYDVPEGGAHNMWVENDIMYMGYYNAGARVVDVSGELRGDLYRQGREIARLWTGDPKGYRPNAPFCWGAQPHNGLVYFSDINSGVWIMRLGGPAKATSTSSQ
jgi:hypothetical protein